MADHERDCPKCGGPMIRDGVDIGVGVQPFPWIECACGYSIHDEVPDDGLLLPDDGPHDAGCPCAFCMIR